MSNWSDHKVASITNGAALTVIIDGEYFTISSENPNFETARTALAEKNIEGLVAAIKPIEVVKKVTSVFGEVRVENDAVYYGDTMVHNVVVDRILEFARKGFDFEPLAKFLANLLQNPSKTAVDELYLFLESSATPMPITEDGHFLAYKKVRSNFKDIYSNTVDYSVGATPSMPRNAVDDVRDRTCSSGLHFCSLSYLQHFGYHRVGGEVVVIVKINPADVVSIPSDYNNAKGRACRMEVIGIHKQDQYTPAWTDGYVETSTVKTAPTTAKVNEYDASRVTFYWSREDAREQVRRHGGKFVDFNECIPGTSPVVPKNVLVGKSDTVTRRWGVYN